MIVEPLRRALDFGERPDPAQGVFETILVRDGRAPLLEPQLERLAESAHELYGLRLQPERLAAEARDGLPAQIGRLRIGVVPSGATTIGCGPRGPDPSYERIAPFLLAGGLGAHKWTDRRLPEALTAAAGSDALPLLLDADCAVLESVRMNVLIEERGRLVSPPADGRFRAGFGRVRLRYDEEPVDLDRLLAADAVVLTSALRVVRLPLAS